MNENPSEITKLLRIQLRELTILVQEVAAAKFARAENPKSITHTALLGFAEDLMLCPSEDAVRVRIQRGLREAQQFLKCADTLVGGIEKIDEKPSLRSVANDTPFFLLANTAKDFLELVRKNCPEDWGKIFL